MDVYHYDSLGFYTGRSDLRIDPMVGFRLPELTTVLAPQPLAAGGWGRFVEGAWTLVPDVRGCWFLPDRTEITIGSVAATVPEGATRTVPPLTLPELQAAKISSLTASYLAELQLPISYTGAVFQADLQSQALLTQVISAAGGVVPVDFGWYDIANLKVVMNFTQLQGLATAILLRSQPLYRKLQEKKKAARDAVDSAALEFVVW